MTTPNHHPTPPSPRSRGSVLLLVVVSLVLMVLLGSVYMQVVNIQRQIPPAPPRNIDQVLQSVENLLLQTILDDLRDNNGNYFNQSTASADAGDEPYDFPYTNHNYTTTYLDPYTGNSHTPAGGRLDDRWLAYTVPTYNGTKMVWPKISSITGVYQTGPGGTSNLSSVPAGSTSTAAPITSANKLDENINFDSTQLVDADGDGVGDSRWERAPLAQQDGVQYFFTTRVIDLASLINTQTALGLSDAAGNFDTDTDRPRSNQPSELDFNRFAQLMAGGPGLTDAQKLYEYRFNLGPAPVQIPYANRIAYWTEAGSRPGNLINFTPMAGYQTLPISDELDLRFRNGLVPANDPFGSRLRGEMPTLTRHAATGETAYNTGTPYANAKAFFDNNARLYMTTRSAEASWQPKLPAETGTPTLKFGLNDPRFLYNGAGNPDAALTAALSQLADGQILPVITAGGTPMPLPAGSSALPGVAGNTTPFAFQWVASLQDYRDRDNKLTTLNGRVGLEALPALTEVYLQRPYEMTLATPTNATFHLRYDAKGEPGYAIEIRNPFRKPVSLENVRLLITGIPADHSGTPEIDISAAAGGADLDDLVGDAVASHNATAHPSLPAADARKLYPGDALLLYHNSTGGDATFDDVTGQFGGDGATHIRFPLDGSDAQHPDVQWPTTPGSDAKQSYGAAEISVELRGTAQNNTPLTWAYQLSPQYSLNDAFRLVTQPAPKNSTGTPGRFTYVQSNFIGNGDGLNALLVDRPGYTLFLRDITTPGPAATTPYEGYSTTNDALGEPNKTTAGGPGNKVSGGPSQFVIADHADERLIHPGELLLVPVLGIASSAPTTYAAAWGTTARPVTDFLVNPSPATLIDATRPAYNLPHAQFLMNRVTLLDPSRDGIDNDGDGAIDNPAEQIVAGQINLNTIPAPLLDAALPIPDDAIRNATAAAIVARRNTPAADGARGIAHPWQLYGDLAPAYTTGAYAGDTRVADGANPVRLDTLSNPDPATGDGIADDREELLLLLKHLDPIATTRSDVFCAFILVHGYKTGAFNQGPVEIARELIIFSRANVRTATDQPVILARYRYQ